MDFEGYLISKRIDSARFKSAEPELWQSWRADFEQMHPNSFTLQKLNLINPIRRKYQLVVTETPKTVMPPVIKGDTLPGAGGVAKVSRPEIRKEPVPDTGEPASTSDTPPPVKAAKPAIPRPVIKPKPKTN